jgi:hypothetical protein
MNRKKGYRDVNNVKYFSSENPCVLKQIYCRYLKYNNPTYLERYEVMHAGTCDGSDPTKTVAVSLVKREVWGTIALRFVN